LEMSQTLSPQPAKIGDDQGRRISNAERRASFIAEVQKKHDQKVSEKPFVAKNLTSYQVDKLTALFEKYLDVDKDGIFTERDIESLNEKIFDFTGWSRDDPKALKLIEYHRDLYKCLLMEINKDILIEEHKMGDISLIAWMKMWDRLMRRTAALAHLPQWVQVMPYNLFTFIDKKGDKHISKEGLQQFYTDFMLLDDKRGKLVTENAWTQMTGNGDFKLDLDLYTMCFSNFLFGKSFYGPGLYILGTFTQCVEREPFKFVTHVQEED